MERLADTVTGGRDDDDNTGRKLVPGISSVVVVTCDFLGDRRGGCSFLSHARCCKWFGENPPWKGQNPGVQEQS